MASPTTYRAAESVAIIGMRAGSPAPGISTRSGRISPRGRVDLTVFPGGLRVRRSDRVRRFCNLPPTSGPAPCWTTSSMFDAPFFGYSATDAE